MSVTRKQARTRTLICGAGERGGGGGAVRCAAGRRGGGRGWPRRRRGGREGCRGGRRRGAGRIAGPATPSAQRCPAPRPARQHKHAARTSDTAMHSAFTAKPVLLTTSPSMLALSRCGKRIGPSRAYRALLLRRAVGARGTAMCAMCDEAPGDAGALGVGRPVRGRQARRCDCGALPLSQSPPTATACSANHVANHRGRGRR